MIKNDQKWSKMIKNDQKWSYFSCFLKPTILMCLSPQRKQTIECCFFAVMPSVVMLNVVVLDVMAPVKLSKVFYVKMTFQFRVGKKFRKKIKSDVIGGVSTCDLRLRWKGNIPPYFPRLDLDGKLCLCHACTWPLL